MAITPYDVIILGSGFAGSLLALILKQCGLRVALVEQGSQPRFTIGESSTPLADFKLQTLAHKYDLPWLLPLSKYGSWQRHYPELPCGLKRGFSFFTHQPNQPFFPEPFVERQLLVAASPNADLADTHWFRADFDWFLCQQAQRAGCDYFERCQQLQLIQSVPRNQSEEASALPLWQIRFQQHESDGQDLQAHFLVDGSGTGKALATTLQIPLVTESIRTRTYAIYNHFHSVRPWQETIDTNFPDWYQLHPFPCDQAALHHLLEEGWMWQLRFNNGITSAGFSLQWDLSTCHAALPVEEQWQRLLQKYPSIAQQFAQAQPVQSWFRTGRLQRQYQQVVGTNWALLPHTAGFIDPWLSPGIAHSLYGVARLAQLLTTTKAETLARQALLEDYQNQWRREFALIDRITAACFQHLSRFPILTACSMMYFVAAIFSEERERRGTAVADHAFLLADEPEFVAIVEEFTDVAWNWESESTTSKETFQKRLYTALKPFDVVGICQPELQNRIPFISQVHTSMVGLGPDLGKFDTVDPF